MVALRGERSSRPPDQCLNQRPAGTLSMLEEDTCEIAPLA